MARVLLALDLASTMGWCVGAPGAAPRFGSVRLDGQGRAARYAALLDWLDDAHGVHGFEDAVCEAPLVTGDFAGRDAALLALGFAAHVELWAWDNGVRLLPPVVVGTARKGVLGRGSFPKGTAKAVVMEWARAAGYAPGDDNAADALLLWHHVAGSRPAVRSAAA